MVQQMFGVEMLLVKLKPTTSSTFTLRTSNITVETKIYNHFFYKISKNYYITLFQLYKELVSRGKVPTFKDFNKTSQIILNQYKLLLKDRRVNTQFEVHVVGESVTLLDLIEKYLIGATSSPEERTLKKLILLEKYPNNRTLASKFLFFIFKTGIVGSRTVKVGGLLSPLLNNIEGEVNSKEDMIIYQ